jgi:hypothetical protein
MSSPAACTRAFAGHDEVTGRRVKVKEDWYKSRDFRTPKAKTKKVFLLLFLHKKKRLKKIFLLMAL